ncbi:MAG: hypothetical protein LBS65_02765 [Desulfovibrio sp.]|jgi:hypothetical protein|nr:hypothetical protein [Desulfovibrio sp.]
MMHDPGTRILRLRDYAEAHCAKLAGACPAFAMVFSVSDGPDRAFVLHSCGDSFALAWEPLLMDLRGLMKRKGLAGAHLRLDWVEEALPMTWELFQQRLDKTKRGYFRYGIALDPAFRVLLTEQECNANAIFHGGARVELARFNPGNFSVYARWRFPEGALPPSSPETPVWLISTAGAYCGADGTVCDLPGPARDKRSGLTARGLYAGHREIRRLTPGLLRELIGGAGLWLARQVREDGMFVYGHFPCFGRLIDAYNVLRHAASCYGLLEAWAHTGEAALREPALMSLRRLGLFTREFRSPSGGYAAFVVDGDEIKLGSNAMALLAFCRWRELTGSDEFAGISELLAEGTAYMQDPETGAFAHVLNGGDFSLKEKTRVIYYDGEAVFALLRFYRQTGNPRWLALARKSFDSFLLDSHSEAHDHWLSYSANELTEHVPDMRYFRFGINNCFGFLDFVLRRETTYPTLLELMMAAQKMLTRMSGMPEAAHLLAGLDMDKFRAALHYRAHYLLNGCFWPEMAMFYKYPDSILGSFFIRHHAFRVRIDDVEHYLCGLVAYARMLEAGDPRWAAPEDPGSFNLS